MDDIDALELYNDWIDDQIVAEHYQEEHMDEELEELYENLDFYSDWIDELEEAINIKERYILELEEQVAKLEERIENQRRVILSLRNKNSQLIGDIRELLDDKEYEWQHSC